MRDLNIFDWAVLVLLVIGGINWGMIGVFNTDLVSAVFGVATMLTRTVYVIVGIAGLYSIYILTTKTE